MDGCEPLPNGRFSVACIGFNPPEHARAAAPAAGGVSFRDVLRRMQREDGEGEGEGEAEEEGEGEGEGEGEEAGEGEGAAAAGQGLTLVHFPA